MKTPANANYYKVTGIINLFATTKHLYCKFSAIKFCSPTSRYSTCNVDFLQLRKKYLRATKRRSHFIFQIPSERNRKFTCSSRLFYGDLLLILLCDWYRYTLLQVIRWRACKFHRLFCYLSIFWIEASSFRNWSSIEFVKYSACPRRAIFSAVMKAESAGN